MRGLFITGTDTGVGKTVASAALMCRFRADVPLRYWKPIQTGIEQDDDTAEVRRLARCTAEELFDEGVRLRHPVSPHLAAQCAGERIDLDALHAPICEDHRRWIVEGAGGVLVPVNESQLMIDLIAVLQLPVLIVARSTLGTINHTLLTVEALRARGIPIAGVAMNGEPNAPNRAAIEMYGQVKVVAELPILKPVDAALLGGCFDRCLLEFLR